MITQTLDILIVNFNTSDLLDSMFAALRSSDWRGELRCLVVDNASRDDSVAKLQTHYPDVHLILNEQNVGFGRANNQLLPLLQGQYVLLLNTDAFVSPDTLSKTIDYMTTHSDCGVLGGRLVGKNGVLQPSCRYFPTPINVFLTRTGLARFFPWVREVDDMTWDHASVRECDWVPGCYYLIRREVIDQVGLFDPRFFLYYEEIDHCKRVKAAGWKVVYYPYTQVVHLGGESAKSEGSLTESGRQLDALQTESELLYFRKHHGLHQFIMHVLLSTFTDLINLGKGIVRARPFKQWNQHAKHLTLLWKLVFRTHAGSRPTR